MVVRNDEYHLKINQLNTFMSIFKAGRWIRSERDVEG